MEWSAGLLDERERLLWARAAVFAGGFDLTVAEVVCADDRVPEDDLLDALGALVDASLLTVTRDGTGSRFGMLETVRAFGRDLLEASGQADAVRRRHRDWCARLVADAAADFLGPGQVAAFDRLAAVHAELDGAVEHCLRTPGEESAGLVIVADAWLYWAARGHLGEGRRRLDQLLRAVPATCPERARGLVVAGYLALVATDPQTAVRCWRRRCGTRGPWPCRRWPRWPPSTSGRRRCSVGTCPPPTGCCGRRLPSTGRSERRPARSAGPTSAWCPARRRPRVRRRGVRHEPRHRRRPLDPVPRPVGPGSGAAGRRRPRSRGCLEEQALRLMREVDDRSGVALCVTALGWTAAARGTPRRPPGWPAPPTRSGARYRRGNRGR
jgi:non-specific serine/threonine protein kinase